jgi:sulfate permease, SulP family
MTRAPRPDDGPYAGDTPFQAARRRAWMARAIPVSEELSAYRVPTARRDLIAAVTVAALALPSAMAYAEVAGVPAVNGLYALLLPAVAYALLGSSRQLVIGPEGSISALTGAIVISLAVAGSGEAAHLAAMLALLVAACFVAARALRLGWIADYVSRPVMIGYIHGVVVVLIVGQIPKLLGVDIDATDPIPQLVEIARQLGDVSGATLAVSAGALALLLPLRFLAPRVPAPLLAVVGGIALSAAADLAAHGVAVIGAVPSGLPSVELPRVSFGDVVRLAPAAVGIFLLTFADAVMIARTYAGRRGQHVVVGQELLAVGAANAASGVTLGIPVGASTSRTAVADSMGVRTQVAGLLSALVIVVVLVFLTGPVADLPKAVLGATIVSACIGLVDPGAWRHLWRADRVEATIAAVTTAGVVINGVLEAITFAVGLSIVDVVRRSARPHDAVLGWVETMGRYADVSLHPRATVTPGVVVYRMDDRLFFANAGYFKARVREAVRGAPTPTRWVVVDAEAIIHVDTAGMLAIAELAAELHGEGITMLFARMKSPMQARLDESGLTAELGADNFHPTVRRAVAACVARDVAAAGKA